MGTYNNKDAGTFLFSTENTAISGAKTEAILEAKPEWAKLPLTISKVAPDGTPVRTTILPDVLDLMIKFSTGKDFALVKIGANEYGCEMKLPDADAFIVSDYNSTNGSISMAKVSKPAIKGKEFFANLEDLDPKNPFYFASLYGCILASLWDHKDVPTEEISMDVIRDVLADTDLDQTANLIQAVSSTIQTSILNGIVPVTIPSTGNIPLLEKKYAQKINGEILWGATNFIGEQKKSSAIDTLGNLKKEFAAFRRDGWTESQKKLIPVYPDKFICPPEVRKFLTAYTKTQNTVNPMVNFLWVGSSGYGKSTGVRLLACILNIPLFVFTCSPNTEKADFFDTLIPVTDKDQKKEIPYLNREDLEWDLEGSWNKLTDEDPPEEITVEDVCLKYAQVLMEAGSKTKANFKYVRSTLCQALEDGCLCEIQEPSRVQRQGELVGLNETALPNAVIPHIDGTYGRRHPQAIVIYTDNQGLDTCNDLDASVISRFALKLISDQPTKKFIIERLKQATGVTDKEILSLAYAQWILVNRFCKEHMISDGAGIRELTNLVTMLHIEGIESLEENIQCCILNKVIPEEADRAACLKALKEDKKAA